MKATREKITLNIGGVRYETYLSTLQAFPGTKLCRLTEPQACTMFEYDPNIKEFFFDRNAHLFDEVLNYYRTKHLHCPQDICQSVFEEELVFWEISDAVLAPCCWQKLSDMESQQEDYILWDDKKDTDNQGLLVQGERRNNSCRARWQPKIWALFEKPLSSLSAKFLAAVSLLFNIGICILFIGKTYRETEFFHTIDVYHSNSNTTYLREAKFLFHKRFPYFLYLELFCVLWFLFEFSSRLTFCPEKKKFLRNPLNVVDFLSLFPVFIELCSPEHTWLGLFRVLYILKLLKMLKIIETPLMFRVLSYTSRSILREVFIFMTIFVFEVLFFGVLIFYSELIENSAETYFDSIGASIWWAVITLTTVGYGDMYPVGGFSKVIGACTALCGVLTIIVPIPIFFSKFKGYYDAAIIKEKMKRKQAPTQPS
ncbi:potassium voltage-gated channel subfamily C member 1-like [Rhineura floridana]|uniref:potassium voltage-gated channel subfamily C member 1-like n=1 Tax=Rhineura floridana TaxID=261503 RepID=UPI002AC7EB39|nr:potassium voltage-gated channel subfamily C member 1-like [Rhineura floridana]XP_061454616.1 potassium voltage-gated channel subfamily C member 1-like [Rhineura floridana]